MEKTPRVSVVLPTHNRSETLSRSIGSVLCQTYHDFDLILVDDASTDDTEEVVKAFDDNRIYYKKLSKNVGGAEARNVGIQLARGDYVAFQDSDDEWTCTHLEKSVATLDSNRKIGVVFSAFIQIGESGCRKMPMWSDGFQHSDFYGSLLWRNVVGTPTVVARRSALESVGGFDASMPRYQDWELSLRLAQVVSFKYLEEPGLLSYITPSSITQNQEAHAIALQAIYDKHANSIKNNRSLQAAWFHRMGDAKMSLNKKGGRRLLLNAVVAEPTNLRYLIKAILSLSNNNKIYARGKSFFERN